MRAANITPTNANVQHLHVSKNNAISISSMGNGTQPQLELQLQQDGSQQPMLQLPQFSTQFAPGSGATFVPLQNSIHPNAASGGFDHHLSLEDQKPDLGQLNNQQLSQNAMVYPSDDGMGGGSSGISQGGSQVCIYKLQMAFLRIIEHRILFTIGFIMLSG